MADPRLNFASLPTDILYLIFPYLDPREFLALCSTSKTLWSLHKDSSYWHPLTRSTFRLPSQPLLKADGARWQWLYKTLATQSRVYTWGENKFDCLGHTPRRWETLPGNRQRVLLPTDAAWPTEMSAVRDGAVGVVVDVQCGGWSTTLLSSKGALYCCGRLDGLHFWRDDVAETPGLEPLLFPPGYPNPKDRYDPVTAIAQFSSGRSNVLGLSDSGRIWLWANVADPAVHVRFLHLDSNHTEEARSSTQSSNLTKRVLKVVAGWDRLSAYISGVGIVIWTSRRGSLNPNTTTTEATDGLELEMNYNVHSVPGTWYSRPKGNARDIDPETKTLGETIGQVMNYIVLESYVVVVTDLGKVFAANTANNSDLSDGLVELTTLSPAAGKTNVRFSDVQGSFRTFAAFTTDGNVVIGSRDYLDYMWTLRFEEKSSEAVDSSLPKYYPAMQHQGIISVAFGDYHMHALHSNGQVSSFGTEPQSCGALGLGGHLDGGWLRGISNSPQAIFQYRPGRDCTLPPEKFSCGRRIWFEQEKKGWLNHMSRGGSLKEQIWKRIFQQWSRAPGEAQAELTDWFEQMGADWDKQPDVAGGVDSMFGAYFVLSIAAAGWHSASLVLVNDELVRKIEDKYTVPVAVPPPSFSPMGPVFGWLYRLGRRFLGLEPADSGQIEDSTAPATKTQLKYTWSSTPFPRIKLSTGQVIGSDGPTWERKDGVFVIVEES
ncbi:MAG: hypothetical protein M1835_003686 [Candelina submexicana]|nr:MAG: hypothetical protein M1835_003686 [Candelina submexicana]